MPKKFMSDSKADITSRFLQYLKPLLGSFEAETYQLKAPKVERLGLKDG